MNCANRASGGPRSIGTVPGTLAGTVERVSAAVSVVSVRIPRTRAQFTVEMRRSLVVLSFALLACGAPASMPDGAAADSASDGGPRAEERDATTDSTATSDAGSDAGSDSGVDVVTDVASDAEARDAVVVDARRVTYEGEVRAILRDRCGTCHSMGSSPLAESYAYTQQRGHSWCSGELVGDCVERHARGQRLADGTQCGSSLFYHRDWVPCMSEDERSLVLQWHASGMPER